MSDSTVYKKIIEYLLELIEVNGATPDFKLPSERLLDEKFNTSRRAVRLAYSKLIERGLVQKTHGKGYFIKEIIKTKNDAISELRLKKIHFITPSIKSVFMREIIRGIKSFCEKNLLDLSIKISDQSAAKEKRLVQTSPSSDAKGFILYPIDNEYYNSEQHKVLQNEVTELTQIVHSGMFCFLFSHFSSPLSYCRVHDFMRRCLFRAKFTCNFSFAYRQYPVAHCENFR